MSKTNTGSTRHSQVLCCLSAHRDLSTSRNFSASLGLLLLSLCLFSAGYFPAWASQVVKLSNSGICHDSSSPYYDRTKSFTPYQDLNSCLDAGRLPKGQAGAAASISSSTASASLPAASSQYARNAFGDWADLDQDCIDTRHEILAELSTARALWNDHGCRVVRGRWNDPYTDQVFLDPGDLDIDHIVPLAWSWSRGSNRWTTEQRIRFANDPVNLIAVEAAANRSKGAKGPTEWLPPARAYHCEYVLRFTRVALSYGLLEDARDRAGIDETRKQACGK